MTGNICRAMYENFSKLMSNPKQKAFFDWVLANGEGFKGRKLTRAEKMKLQARLSRRIYTPRYCFYQSQIAATDFVSEKMDGKLRYFEGNATCKRVGIPFEHAWLVDAEGRVWDTTWKDGVDYFGVEIPTDFVRKNMLETGEAQYLLPKYYYEEVLKNGKKEN